MEEIRKYSVYRIKDKNINNMTKDELIESVRLFATAATNEALRSFLMDIADGRVSGTVKGYTTAELVEELKTREGVGALFVEPSGRLRITVHHEAHSGLEPERLLDYADSGPVTVLYVVD